VTLPTGVQETHYTGLEVGEPWNTFKSTGQAGTALKLQGELVCSSRQGAGQPLIRPPGSVVFVREINVDAGPDRSAARPRHTVT